MSRFVGHCMGMPISLALRGRHSRDEQARHAWIEVMADLRAADALFSPFKSDSWVSRFRREEVTLADAPDQVAQVIGLGLRAEQRSGGAFSMWLGAREGTFDPSGVVKGWALQRAADAHLAPLLDTDYCLSGGGDLVMRSDSQPWRIGIEDPHNVDRLRAVVPLTTGAVATSGIARRGAHVIDPRTGEPVLDVASVTVIADDLITADIEATTVMVLGREQGVSWLTAQGARTGLFIDAAGSAQVLDTTAAAA